jgi:ATP-dependent DNA ligase
VKINDYSETAEYTGGYALRVPKIVRFRPDKKIEEINSIEKLRKSYEMRCEQHPFQSL